jgi:hypothetical protein
MEVIGVIKLIGDTQVVSDKFRKREFVLTTEASSQYPQHIPFQLVQDKVELINNFHVGEEVKVQFNLRGREWNGNEGVKYFVSLEIWRIEPIGGGI